MENGLGGVISLEPLRQSDAAGGRFESIRSSAVTGVAPGAAATTTVPAKANDEALGKAVAKINDFVHVVRRDLQFSVDDATGRTVVRVMDAETEQMIRQIPSEEVLALAENLDELSGVLFEGRA